MANSYPATRRSPVAPAQPDFPGRPPGLPTSNPVTWPANPGTPANDNFKKLARERGRWLRRLPGPLALLGLAFTIEELLEGGEYPLPAPGPNWRLVADCGFPRSKLIRMTWTCGVPRTKPDAIPFDFAYFGGLPQLAVYYHPVGVNTDGDILYVMSQYWNAVTQQPQAVPTNFPRHSPLPDPFGDPFAPPVEPMPSKDPMRVPPASPQPTPQQLPWKELPGRVINPYTPERTDWGYHPAPAPVPWSPPAPTDWELYPDPHQLEPQTPTVPGGQPGRDPVIPRPPGKGEKERKLRPKGTRAILRFANFVSEGVDLMDAIYWALPKKYTSSKHNGTQRAEQLWKHFDEVDLNKALENIAINEWQDRIFGKIGQRVGERARLDGRPASWLAGPAL